MDDCDTFIAFTEPEGTMSRGGRHVEWDYVQTKDGDAWVVGPLESQFYTLADRHWATWDECIAFVIAEMQESR